MATVAGGRKQALRPLPTGVSSVFTVAMIKLYMFVFLLGELFGSPSKKPLTVIVVGFEIHAVEGTLILCQCRQETALLVRQKELGATADETLPRRVR